MTDTNAKIKCLECKRTILVKNMEIHAEKHRLVPKKTPKETKTIADVVAALAAIYGEIRNIYDLMAEELGVEDDPSQVGEACEACPEPNPAQ